MASTVTLLQTRTDSYQGLTPIRLYRLDHDGASGPEIIHTPTNANLRVYLVKLQFCKASPGEQTWYSGIIPFVTYDLSANQGLFSDYGIYFQTNEGEPYLIDSTEPTSLLVEVVEATRVTIF